MVGRALIIASLTGCGFQHGFVGDSALANGSDAATIDAQVRTDAPADAEAFLDAPQPVLTVTRTVLGTIDIDLTSEGTLDWAHWGTVNSPPFFDHKATGGSAITNVTKPPPYVVSQLPVSASWTDGTPHQTVSQTATGIAVTAPGNLSFSAPAGTAVHTLRVYVGGKSGTERLDVALSDNSATAYTNTVAIGAAMHFEYEIRFAAMSAGQTLSVTWTDTGDSTGNGAAMLMSATLQ